MTGKRIKSSKMLWARARRFKGPNRRQRARNATNDKHRRAYFNKHYG